MFLNMKISGITVLGILYSNADVTILLIVSLEVDILIVTDMDSLW